MYKVAVILNESEILRSGYARVTPKLKKLSHLSYYAFDSFTVVNIVSLFQNGTHNVHNYDSLVITTNATSDVAVHEALKKNKNEIKKFLSDGKGLFIASQKKLSTVSSSDSTVSGLTEFLPSYYEFSTIERPSEERDSGMGFIAIEDTTPNHILLSYPEKVTAKTISDKCTRNEFRRHFYRSHLKWRTIGAYQPVLVDNQTDRTENRSLLITSQSPKNQERVVVSTVVIDWEFHEELLTNILVYVTEGPPRVAFIKKRDLNDGDYNFILSSARLSKVPHVVYEDMDSIPKEMINVHTNYIFSPGWPEQNILDFSRRSDQLLTSNSIRAKPYRRIYYFRRSDDLLLLTHHSTFSTIDLLVSRSISWLEEKFEDHMWGRSFWITYDVLFMMASLKVDLSVFITPILEDMRKHYKDGSYDGVMGATCGLLELIVLLQKIDLPRCKKSHFGEDVIIEIFNWIYTNLESQSVDDINNALVSISCLTSDLKKFNIDIMDHSELSIRNLLDDILRNVDRLDINNEEISEVDLCRFIKSCLIYGGSGSSRIADLLHGLKARQDTSGAWANVGRTAHVLLFLLENFDTIKIASSSPDVIQSCDDMIYNGVLFLRSSYNWDHANWNDDLQATAKAIHAISLSNKRYAYSTQEVFDTINENSNLISSANLIQSLGDKLSKSRNQMVALLAEISALKQEKKHTTTLLRAEPVWRYGAVVSSTLLIGLLSYLVLDQRQVLINALKSTSILSIIVGIVVGWLLSWVIKIVGNDKTHR